ncbi:MAG: hypothetical protein DHS20C18_11990 [Saprospiraceae bacterium]|nr:MAG: hypothetical protein DHS20C18_11990 [Saprospiraceae bacterium]
MKNTFFIILALVVSATSLSAQREETLFSRNSAWLSGIWGSAMYDYNYFDNDWGMVKGGSFGVEFGRSILLGYGNYRLKDDIRLAGNGDQFDMKYKGLLIGFTPNSYKIVHPKISIFTGSGKVSLQDSNADRVFVFQPSAGIEVNIFKWFRMGLEGGYRFVSNVDLANYSNEDFSAPFAQLELRFGLSWGD